MDEVGQDRVQYESELSRPHSPSPSPAGRRKLSTAPTSNSMNATITRPNKRTSSDRASPELLPPSSPVRQQENNTPKEKTALASPTRKRQKRVYTDRYAAFVNSSVKDISIDILY